MELHNNIQIVAVVHPGQSNCIMFILLTLPAVAITLAIVYAMRSTKDFPRNWAQIKSELVYQYLGLIGVVEDIHNRNRNRIGKNEVLNSSCCNEWRSKRFPFNTRNLYGHQKKKRGLTVIVGVVVSGEWLCVSENGAH